MDKKISVVIPTLQKNVELLKNLIATLADDENVIEIILIDNSTKGFEINDVFKNNDVSKINDISNKLRLINPEKNIFVNPAWNLGVKEAKADIVALLNDDIIIPEGFCSSIAGEMNPDMGVIGYNIDFVETTSEILPPPSKTPITLTPLKYRSNNWGIAIFFYKTSYFEIPENLKIYFGDDWIFNKNKKLKRINYSISGQKIYHFGSLTSKGFSKAFVEEEKIYKKLTLNPLQRLVNFEGIYGGFKVNFFGIKLTIRKKQHKQK